MPAEEYAGRPGGRPDRGWAGQGRRRLLAGAWSWALLAGAHAQSVTFNGMLGDRALLVIDGQAKTLAVGGSAQGVKLLRIDGDRAQIEVGGRTQSLRLGGSVAGGGIAGGAGGTGESRIVLSAGPGGHFMGLGSINGHSMNFLVDTGASTVAIGRDEAERLGLAAGDGGATSVMTANGAVAARTLTLTTLRVGDVTVNDVPAIVMPQAMPYVLLGNSFLTRFQMRRDNDTMVLEKKP